MTTFQKRSGSWRAIVRIKGYPDKSKTFQKKAQAMEWAQDIENSMRQHTYEVVQGDKNITVSTAIKKYIDEVSPYMEIGRSKKAVLEKLRVSPIGLKAVIDLELNDFKEHASKRRKDDGALPQTISQDINYLLDVLKTGRLMWQIPFKLSLVDSVRSQLKKLKLIGKSAKRTRRPKDDELEKLKEYSRANKRAKIPMADIIDFAVATAMRLGEICRITWDDLERGDKPMITIRDRKDPEAKEGNDQRVPLLPAAIEVVERQPPLNPNIFPYDPRSVSVAFTRACSKLKINDLRFHDLRHEGASRLFEQGYQIQEVAMITGHKDWSSLKRYTQLKPEDLHRD